MLLSNKELWVLEEVERGQSCFRNQDTVCLLQVARTSATERNPVGEPNSNWEEISSRPMGTGKMPHWREVAEVGGVGQEIVARGMLVTVSGELGGRKH